jgi:hypothetical protein
LVAFFFATSVTSLPPPRTLPRTPRIWAGC